MRFLPRFSFVVVNVFTVLFFALLLLLTQWFAASQQQVKIEAIIKAETSILANSTAESLRVSVEALRAVASMLTAFEEVDYATFSQFASRYLENGSGLLILEWQPQVAGEERADFIKRARQSGQPEFDLWEPDPDGRPMRADSRALHVPVYYMLSRHNIADTTGLDLAWSAERMLSNWQARDTGQPQSSGFFNVVTRVETGYNPSGFAITLPIFQNGVIPDDPTQRPERLLGYLAGVYAIESVLKPHLDNLTPRGFNVAITDGSDSGIGVFRRAGNPSDYEWSLPVNLFGQDWLFSLTATEMRVADEDDPLWTLLPALTLLLGLMVLGFLQLLQRKNIDLEFAQRELAAALHKVKESESFLRELSRHDPLTGLFNRRAFIDQLEQELERSERHGFVSSLMMLDIDHFKRINDQWGHPTGDHVLKVFAELCLDSARSTDMVARIGGEEFGFLLPHTDAEAARVIAERLRERVKERAIAVEGAEEPLRITVSIGLAATESGLDSNEIVSRADKALYLAKQSGRNIVKVFS